uniref:Uncharacterized protein n=1 Tax=Eutreptiella gymnastica TaxID=73025 RepID=A0A7S4FZQ5_9EUGL
MWHGVRQVERMEGSWKPICQHQSQQQSDPWCGCLPCAPGKQGPTVLRVRVGLRNGHAAGGRVDVRTVLGQRQSISVICTGSDRNAAPSGSQLPRHYQQPAADGSCWGTAGGSELVAAGR